jgi:hypothetical protein
MTRVAGACIRTMLFSAALIRVFSIPRTGGHEAPVVWRAMPRVCLSIRFRSSIKRTPNIALEEQPPLHAPWQHSSTAAEYRRATGRASVSREQRQRQRLRFSGEQRGEPTFKRTTIVPVEFHLVEVAVHVLANDPVEHTDIGSLEQCIDALGGVAVRPQMGAHQSARTRQPNG